MKTIFLIFISWIYLYSEPGPTWPDHDALWRLIYRTVLLEALLSFLMPCICNIKKIIVSTFHVPLLFAMEHYCLVATMWLNSGKTYKLNNFSQIYNVFPVNILNSRYAFSKFTKNKFILQISIKLYLSNKQMCWRSRRSCLWWNSIIFYSAQIEILIANKIWQTT